MRGACSRPPAVAALWAVVKADGYGQGAVECAGAALAAGAERICCATLEEARELRAGLGATVPIIVLSPLEPGEEALAGGFEIVVSSLEDYGRLRAAGVACGVHVKADTGMGRWGMAPADALATGRELAAGGGPLRLAGAMSHLATSDDDAAFAALQTAAFAAFEREFPPCPRHLANSAAALALPDTRYDAVRCGIALYGVSPFGGDPSQRGLVPALRWTSRVAALRDLAPGQSAGYGRRLIADRPLRVAYVPVGYADGYPRLASGRAEVLVRGRRRLVAATISMDQLTCVVDESVELDDEVVLIGVQGDERDHGRGAGRARRDDRLRDRVRDGARRTPRLAHLRRYAPTPGRPVSLGRRASLPVDPRGEDVADLRLRILGRELQGGTDLGDERLFGLVAEHALRVIERAARVGVDERGEHVDDAVEVAGAEPLLEPLQLLVPGEARDELHTGLGGELLQRNLRCGGIRNCPQTAIERALQRDGHRHARAEHRQLEHCGLLAIDVNRGNVLDTRDPVVSKDHQVADGIVGERWHRHLSP